MVRTQAWWIVIIDYCSPLYFQRIVFYLDLPSGSSMAIFHLRFTSTNAYCRIRVFNATFNNIPDISWRSVVLVEETRILGKKHRPATSHWQTNTYPRDPFNEYINVCYDSYLDMFIYLISQLHKLVQTFPLICVCIMFLLIWWPIYRQPVYGGIYYL